MKFKLLWFLNLFYIFTLSTFGRNIQEWISQTIGRSILSWIISGVIFFSLGFLFLKANVKSFLVLLLIPLVLLLSWLVPLPEERLHFITFGFLGFFSAKLFSFRVALLVCGLVSGLDELYQWYLPNRVGELRDVVLNLAASFFGVFSNSHLHRPTFSRRIS
jgi:hypothetical protein